MSTELTPQTPSSPAGSMEAAYAVPARPLQRRPAASRAKAIARRGSLVLAGGVIVVALAWAFFPDLFTSQSPVAINATARYQPISPAHWFGTDNLGRDLYSRVVHGAGLSLQAAVIAVLVGLGAGSVIGLVSGYAGGAVDAVLMRFIDVTLAIPGLLLSLLVVTALGFGTLNVAIAVGVGAVASFARVMRAEVMRVRTSPYVEAAGASGVRLGRILLRYVLPNSGGPVVALAGLEFGSAILSVAALGFLGFGAAPPQPEWGSLVAEGRNYLASAWWMSTMPGLVVVVVVISANVLARRLYRRFV